MKRKNYISWDQYFMGIAKLSAHRSKDPHTQVGCCIVNKSNRIVSLGYNGLPAGCEDDNFPWERTNKNNLKNKYLYVCHSELNAILNARGRDLTNCKLYVTLFPCNECAKAIIQSGINEVVYEQDLYPKLESTIAAKKMFKAANVKLTKFHNTGKEIKFKV